MPISPQPKVWGYNGEATDGKTGMVYLRARYYSTGMSRFVQEDSWKGELKEPISLNRYGYALDNPVLYNDDGGNRAVRVSKNDARTKDYEKLVERQNAKRRKKKSRESYKTKKSDDSDGNSSGGGGSSAQGNSSDNRVKNPYAIGPEYVTEEELVYICNAYSNRYGKNESMGYWGNDKYFKGNWFLDEEKLEYAVEQLAKHIGGNETWELDNTNQMKVLQAILRVQDTNVTGAWDGDTLTNIECRLLASGLDYSDPMNLTSDDIFSIYNSIDQKRSAREEWYINGGSGLVNGIFVLGGNIANQYVSNLGNTPMTWNEFQHSRAGMYTKKEMSAAYWEYKENVGRVMDTGNVYDASQMNVAGSEIAYEDLATYVNNAIEQDD